MSIFTYAIYVKIQIITFISIRGHKSIANSPLEEGFAHGLRILEHRVCLRRKLLSLKLREYRKLDWKQRKKNKVNLEH